MLDSYNREISYMRISLLDTCDLRCTYCMPENKPIFMNKDHWLSFDQIHKVVKSAVKLGIYKFRLTGGEPLLRPDVEKLVAILASTEGVKILAMTTNGTHLASLAKPLQSAGLQTINISLDTLDPVRYSMITRGGSIEPVLKGIDAAFEADLKVKVNMVIMDQTSIDELNSMKEFIEAKGGRLQTIAMYKLNEIKKDNHPYDRPEACTLCNRIRLTADGKLKPCLHSNDEYILDFNNLENSLFQAIKNKPEKGIINSNINVNSIGG
ncbi:MAG: GTP 3',8-cyclase MoaA [Brevinemataceae bacterium]